MCSHSPFAGSTLPRPWTGLTAASLAFVLLIRYESLTRARERDGGRCAGDVKTERHVAPARGTKVEAAGKESARSGLKPKGEPCGSQFSPSRGRTVAHRRDGSGGRRLQPDHHDGRLCAQRRGSWRPGHPAEGGEP